MWGYIKKALNSTVGTKEFVPLDELMKQNRKFVASNNPYYVVISSSTSYNEATFERQVGPVFKARSTGSVNIKFSYHHGENDNVARQWTKLSIYKNGELVLTTAEYAQTTVISASSIINFEKGDEITVTIFVRNSYYPATKKGYIDYLAYCGDVQDTSLVAIE